MQVGPSYTSAALPGLLQEHNSPPLLAVSTPLAVEAWKKALSYHPDRAYARYICNSLRYGFRVGFQHGAPHPEVVSEYLRKKMERGRILGPFPDTSDLPPLHINRFGVIPKGNNTGKFRLITDLSFPTGSSVNDGIDPDLCSMAYTTVDEVAAQAALLGKGGLLAQIDIESAYRLIPVHPQDRILQAMNRSMWTRCCPHILIDTLCWISELAELLATIVNLLLSYEGK